MIDEEDCPPKPRRAWTYSRHRWDPRWWNKLGVPQFGGDEWGRRTIVLGFGWLGYVCVALWTCWCEDCHVGRAQTYEYARPALMRAAGERWRDDA